jgi:hypothetical protein
MIWVGSNNVQLSDRILIGEVLVNLGPNETFDNALVCGQEKSFWVEPRFCHAVFQVRHSPVPLVWMIGKD